MKVNRNAPYKKYFFEDEKILWKYIKACNQKREMLISIFLRIVLFLPVSSIVIVFLNLLLSFDDLLGIYNYILLHFVAAGIFAICFIIYYWRSRFNNVDFT